MRRWRPRAKPGTADGRASRDAFGGCYRGISGAGALPTALSRRFPFRLWRAGRLPRGPSTFTGHKRMSAVRSHGLTSKKARCRIGRLRQGTTTVSESIQTCHGVHQMRDKIAVRAMMEPSSRLTKHLHTKDKRPAPGWDEFWHKSAPDYAGEFGVRTDLEFAIAEIR